MSFLIDEEIWLNDPTVLAGCHLFPDSVMTKNSKFNALTRLVIVIWLILFALEIKYSYIFLILSILFIILLYYTKMNREHYTDSFQQKVDGYNMLQNRQVKQIGNIKEFCSADDYAYNKKPAFVGNSYTNITEQTGKVSGLLQDNGIQKKQIPYTELKKISSLHKTDVGVDFYAPPIEIQERSLIPPMIVPRVTDTEVWSPNDFKIQDLGKMNKENYLNLTPNVGLDKFCPEPFANSCNANMSTVKNVKMNSAEDPTKLLDYSQDFPVISDYMNLPTNVKIYEDVQPYKDGQLIPAARQPINANYAISEIPNWDMSSEKKYYVQEADKFYSKSNIAETTQQVPYDRSDPQLIRDYGPKGRQAEMPVRSAWSARPSEYEAANPPDFNAVFDPRFSGYGDPYRSYLDADKGNISYYYGDVDAYRHPVFITRSKVDFIEQRQPMGKIWPLYLRDRSLCLDEAVEQAQNRWFTDTTQFREGLMASQMNKRNAESWQQRYAPISLRPT
jgi:hypothetical protein